jgi:leucyl-tRNA synthetase
VVDPDDMIQKYGADALRLYVMFVAPPEKEVEWTDSGLEGSWRFLARVWRMAEPLSELLRGGREAGLAGLELDDAHRALRRKTHQTIERVGGDLYPRAHLNTAVAALMELVNELYAFTDKIGLTKQGRLSGVEVPPATRAVLAESIEALVLMLSPFAPHMAEELWELLGHADGVVAAGWPAFDPAVAAEEAIVVPVQVNGKVRGRVSVPAGADEAALEAAALAEPNVQVHTAGKTIVKVVVAKGRLVSIVVK